MSRRVSRKRARQPWRCLSLAATCHAPVMRAWTQGSGCMARCTRPYSVMPSRYTRMYDTTSVQNSSNPIPCQACCAQASEDAAADYALCAAKLAHYSDYLVLNVSSPNTPGARGHPLFPCLAATKAADQDCCVPMRPAAQLVCYTQFFCLQNTTWDIPAWPKSVEFCGLWRLIRSAMPSSPGCPTTEKISYGPLYKALLSSSSSYVVQCLCHNKSLLLLLWLVSCSRVCPVLRAAGLRALQGRRELERLIRRCQAALDAAGPWGAAGPPPLLVKVRCT